MLLVNEQFTEDYRSMQKDKRTGNGKKPHNSTLTKFIAPRELAERWRCGRSSVDRICGRAGMTRVYLGTGKNGIVRYLREEIEAFEASRVV